MKYNLIMVDDHKMFLDGLVSILEEKEEYNVLFTARNSRHVVKYMDINPDQKIDLIITDISMPELDGVSLNKVIKQKQRNVKTLILSMHNDARTIDDLIKNGINGFISKNTEKEEFFDAIKSVLKGKQYFSKDIIDVFSKYRFSKKKKEEIKLTRREIDVITLIAQEFTTQEIADKLFLSKHTIESYRKNLISKLSVRNLAGLTKYALRMNYINLNMKIA